MLLTWYFPRLCTIFPGINTDPQIHALKYMRVSTGGVAHCAIAVHTIFPWDISQYMYTLSILTRTLVIKGYIQHPFGFTL